MATRFTDANRVTGGSVFRRSMSGGRVAEEDMLDTMGLEEAAEYFVRDVKSRSDEAYHEKKKTLNNYFDHYMNKPIKRDGPQAQSMSNIPVPLATENVDAGVAFMMSKIFQSNRLCNIMPRESSDKDSANVMEDKIEYDNTVMGDGGMGAYDPYETNLMATLIFGTCVSRVEYEEKLKPMRFEGVENVPDQTVYEGTKITPYDPLDVFPSPEKKHINDRFPIILRSFQSWENLKAKADRMEYFDIDDIPEKRIAFPIDEGDRRTERNEILKIQATADAIKDSIEVWECECWFPISGKKDKYGEYIYEPSVITLANGKLIGMKKNANLGADNFLVSSKISSVPGSFWGIGIIEKSHPQIHAANGVLQAILDNLPMVTNKMKVVDRKALMNPSQLYTRPDGIIEVKAGRDVRSVLREIETSPLPQDVYRLLEMLRQWAEMSGGFGDITKGGGGTSMETASEVMEVSNWAGLRGSYYLMNLENTFIVPAHRKQVKINLDMVAPSFVDRIFPGQGELWSKLQRSGGFAAEPDFISMASTRETNERLVIQQAQQLLEISKGHPALEGIMYYVLDHILSLYNWQDKTEILKDIRTGFRNYIAMQEAKMNADASQMPVNVGPNMQGQPAIRNSNGGTGQSGGGNVESRPGAMPQNTNMERQARSLAQSLGAPGRIGG